MSLQTVRSPFALSDYIPLTEHQEQTPDSFYDGKPVLYYHATGAKAWIPKSQRGKLPFFPADLSPEPTAPENSALSGQSEENVEQKVDLFVNSTYALPLSKSTPPFLLTRTRPQQPLHLLPLHRKRRHNPLPTNQHPRHQNPPRQRQRHRSRADLPLGLPPTGARRRRRRRRRL
jgi:hypothetical protein